MVVIMATSNSSKRQKIPKNSKASKTSKTSKSPNTSNEVKVVEEFEDVSGSNPEDTHKATEPKKKRNNRGAGKGFAKAFKMDIGREKEVVQEDWVAITGKSLLMNNTRQNIFRYLCEFPCSTLSNIAHDISVSPPVTLWHLKLLVERNLISEKRLGRQKVYLPKGLVEQKTITVLALLANPKVQNIFRTIFKTPGATQKDIAGILKISHQSINTFTNRLKNEKLITVVKDGKFTRYYPTKRIDELELSQRKKAKEFKKTIIKSFKFDGVNPKLIRATDKQISLQITAGRNIKTLKLSVNPFSSATQKRSKF
jgi:predicted transcriptional regulator